MSIQAVGWALEQELPPGPKLVLIAIANHADNTDGYCWLKTETIAREASYEDRNVYRTIAALVRNGYLRREKKRGSDGKQRANDYWILFNREPAEWAWRTAETSPEADEDETQDVGGKNAPTDIRVDLPDDSSVTKATSGLAQVAVGPTDSCGVHIREPSKTNPKKDSIFEIGRKPPRAYRPPPQPVEPQVEKPPDPVFVIEGTKAWHAWIAYRRANGMPPINNRYGGSGEHKGKTGRHFPSLFPPSNKSTGPPATPSTDDKKAVNQ